MTWLTSDDWNVLLLGDARMPGVASVEVEMPSGVDVKKPKGGRRARVRDTGSPPAKLRIELTLMPEDMAQFQRYLPILRPRGANGVMDPISIGHPNARMWGINNVLVDEISSPMPTTGGYLRIKIKAVEWVPAPKAVKKPKEQPDEDWDKQTRDGIDALNERPSQSGAAEQNFTSADEPLGSGF
jgi:hypothetical protein